MIRLTKKDERGRQVLRLDGNLGIETVGELHRFLQEGNSDVLTLDLDGLTGLDDAGRSLLLRLRGDGRQLRGGSLYIRRFLEETQP